MHIIGHKNLSEVIQEKVSYFNQNYQVCGFLYQYVASSSLLNKPQENATYLWLLMKFLLLVPLSLCLPDKV